jgi:dihydropteroate synthase
LQVVRREQPDAVVSVDTYRPNVARHCIEDWGADIINDVSEGGLTGIVNTPIHEAENMFDIIGQLKVPYILMSVKSNLHDMMISFADEVQQLRNRGVKDIILDPGFGFGKTLQQNYEIYNDMERLGTLQLPLLVGISRKTMIYKLVGGDPTTALNGTTVLNTAALLKGAGILRVHDVQEAVESVKIVSAIQSPSEIQLP